MEVYSNCDASISVRGQSDHLYLLVYIAYILQIIAKRKKTVMARQINIFTIGILKILVHF